MVLSFVPLAFASLSEGSVEVIGVGRIQSAATTRTVGVNAAEKFNFNAIESTAKDAESVTRIAEPLERSVVAPAVPQAPVAPAATQSTGGASAISYEPSDSAAAWQSGLASGYSPANGGNWTALGDAVTDSSMGVAVPVEWRHLLGSSIEIEYGGKTIVVVANDTGGFLKYGRSLDLQPGVWRYFGFGSEFDWGVRTVNWRVL
jgi:rare lipoprotein A (peptidoglycan hydrolase)